MIADIVHKLDAELRREINSERQVVYVLVQVRKLIESGEINGSFDALKLHCDWVLHTRLDRRLARELLAKLNDRYAALLNRNHPQEAIKELGRQLGLNALQAEFLDLLKACGFDGSFLDGNWWFNFLYYYSCVIQDCPLEGEAQPCWHFDRVALVDPDMTVSDRRLYIQWEFLRGEQQVGLWIVHRERSQLTGTTPGPMLSFQ